VGVMIDDLVTRGTREPYRMFTSRAEYRLLLREDNADLRLTPAGRALGLVDDARWGAFEARREALERERRRLKETRLRPEALAGAEALAVLGQPPSRDSSLLDLLRRPEVSYRALMTFPGAGPGVADPSVAEQLEVQAHYHGYIERQEGEVARQRRHEDLELPRDLDYEEVRGLSFEVRQTLTVQRPVTLGHASRIPGVTPAAVSLLLVHLRKRPPGGRRGAGAGEGLDRGE